MNFYNHSLFSIGIFNWPLSSNVLTTKSLPESCDICQEHIPCFTLWTGRPLRRWTLFWPESILDSDVYDSRFVSSFSSQAFNCMKLLLFKPFSFFYVQNCVKILIYRTALSLLLRNFADSKYHASFIKISGILCTSFNFLYKTESISRFEKKGKKNRMKGSW